MRHGTPASMLTPFSVACTTNRDCTVTTSIAKLDTKAACAWSARTCITASLMALAVGARDGFFLLATWHGLPLGALQQRYSVLHQWDRVILRVCSSLLLRAFTSSPALASIGLRFPCMCCARLQFLISGWKCCRGPATESGWHG